MQLDISPSQKWTRPAVSGQLWRWRPQRGGNRLQLSQTYYVIYPYISMYIAPANLQVSQAGSISNLPVDSDLDDAGGGGPETERTQVDIDYLFILTLFISIHTYLVIFMTYSLVFCT